MSYVRLETRYGHGGKPGGKALTSAHTPSGPPLRITRCTSEPSSVRVPISTAPLGSSEVTRQPSLARTARSNAGTTGNGGSIMNRFWRGPPRGGKKIRARHDVDDVSYVVS